MLPSTSLKPRGKLMITIDGDGWMVVYAIDAIAEISL